jgi:hypothetical protein
VRPRQASQAQAGVRTVSQPSPVPEGRDTVMRPIAWWSHSARERDRPAAFLGKDMREACVAVLEQLGSLVLCVQPSHQGEACYLVQYGVLCTSHGWRQLATHALVNRVQHARRSARQQERLDSREQLITQSRYRRQ